MNPERTSLFLMANLGSEVERILDAYESRNPSRIIACLERADRIVEQLYASPDMQPRLTEIETLSEVIKDFGNEVRQYTVEPDELRSYFTPFALRLMRGM
jgi:hypothetical protein